MKSRASQLADLVFNLKCPVEAKKLPPPHELRHSRDCYVVVALDQEEIFRTATVEKSLRQRRVLEVHLQHVTWYVDSAVLSLGKNIVSEFHETFSGLPSTCVSLAFVLTHVWAKWPYHIVISRELLPRKKSGTAFDQWMQTVKSRYVSEQQDRADTDMI